MTQATGVQPTERMVRAAPTGNGAVLPVLAAAVAAGLAWGAATSGLQTVLPGIWTALANSVSAWLVAAFLVGATARRPRVAALAGSLTCLAELAGYDGLSVLRGFGVGTAGALLWAATALVGGPVLGVAGWLWRRSPSTRWSALGSSCLGAAFVAEGAVSYGYYLHYTGDAVLFCTIGLLVAGVLGATAPALRASHDPAYRPIAVIITSLLMVIPAGVVGEVLVHVLLG